MLPIVLATEDELSEAICEKIIFTLFSDPYVFLRLRRGGSGYLRSRIRSLAELSERNFVFLLTDLDNLSCPKNLIGDWVQGLTFRTPNLLFRVAVRETEAWLMADALGVNRKLGINTAKLPYDLDNIFDPKKKLIELASSAPKEVRQAICPARGSVSSQGLEYNSILCGFVRSAWDPLRAAQRSPSLSRCLARLRERWAEVDGAFAR